jgi:chemotaxis protein MotB
LIYGAATRAEEDATIDIAALAFDWDSQDRDEIWLVSYADIISTVLAMVVLLFGRNALTQTIPAATAATEPPAVVAVAMEPRALEILPEPEPEALSIAREANEPTREQRLASLVTRRFDGRIRAEARSEGLVLTIPEVALFASARAALQDGASPLLDELTATLLEAGDAQVSVEGHTDDLPVTGGTFESNWDLAAARANAVTRYLLDHGFAPQRVHSVSYAETRPVADNATADGRAANRRVELKVEFVANAAIDR